MVELKDFSILGVKQQKKYENDIIYTVVRKFLNIRQFF
jgi:hypothetical protein